MSLRQIGGNYNYDKSSGVWDLEDQLTFKKTLEQIDKYSFVKSSSKYWGSAETTEQAFVFNKDGSKAYICGTTTSIIQQHKASIPFDPSTLTPDVEYFSLPNNTPVFTFGNSGNFVYTSNSTTIYQYACATPYTITNLSLVGSIAAETNSTNACLVFSSDGSRLFTIKEGTSSTDSTGRIIHTYNLSTNWNLSTATYDSTKRYTHYEQIVSVAFSSDGTKMYIGNNRTYTDNPGIVKYDLSTPWDITTAYNSVDSYNATSIIGGTGVDGSGICYGDNGNKLYILNFSGQVSQLNLSTPYRANTVTSVVSKTVQPDARPTGFIGLYFKPDGLRYWTCNSNGVIYEIELSTPWDISTATYNSKFIDFFNTQWTYWSAATTVESNLRGIAFKNDGLCLYVLGDITDRIFALELDTAWDINTANYRAFTSPVLNQVASPTITDVTYGNNGNNLYVSVNTAGVGAIYQYTVGTPWNVRRLTYNSKFRTVTTQTTDTRSVKFSSDGTKMYVLGGTVIYQYSLSTAWDVSTATYDSVSFSVSTQATTPQAITFRSDGTKLYVADQGDVIYQYSLTTAWSLSAVTYDTITLNIATAEATVTGLVFGDNGTKLYIVGTTNDHIRQYNLSTAWAINTATLQTSGFYLTVTNREATPTGIDISSDGKTIIVSGDSSDRIYAFKLNTAWSTINNLISNFFAPTTTVSSGLSVGDSNDKFYFANNSTAGSKRIDIIDAVNPNYLGDGGTTTNFVTRNYTVNTVDLAISDNGSYLAVISSTGWIHGFNLPTPYAGTNILLDFYATVHTRGLQLKSEGTDIFSAGLDGLNRIADHTLTTAYNLNTSISTTTIESFNGIFNNNTNISLTSIFLHPSGTFLFGLSSTDYQLVKYKFLTPYNIQTLIGHYIRPITSPLGLTFNSTGSSLYVMTSTTITQYNLNSPYDITSGFTTVGSFTIAQDTTPTGLAISPDSSRLYVSGDELRRIYTYTMLVPNNITTAYFYDAKYLSSESIFSANGISFDPTGRRMYVLNNANDTIFQYSIPTQYNAWDHRFAVYDNKSFNVSALDADPYDIRFMPDGKTFMVLGGTNARIYQVYMETAWDISTAWFEKSRSIATQDGGGATALNFGDSGKKLYVVGSTNDRIYQYSMPTNASSNSTWDISLSTFDNKSFVLPESSIIGFNLNPTSFVNANGDTIPAGTRLLMQGDFSDAYYQRTLTTPWDISTARGAITLVVKDFDDSGATDGSVRGVTFGGSGADKGKKLYVCGVTRGCIIQYELSTAYNLNTASYVARLDFSSTGHSLFPTDIKFNDDGTRLYVCDDNNNRFYEFKLATAWNVSTITYFVKNKVWPNGLNTNASGITFNSGEGGGEAGKKLYVSDSSDGVIYQYQLSTAWDINTLSNTSPTKSKSVSTFDVAPEFVEFSSDGTRLYFGGQQNDRIYEFKCSTPWDVTTSDRVYKTFSTTSQVINATAFTFGGSGANEGRILYVLCNSNDRIYQYDLSTAWDISTATYSNKSYLYGNEITATGFDISRDGEKLYIVGTNDSRIYQYTLSTPWDIGGTVTYDNRSLLVSGVSTTMHSLKISSDGEWIALTDQTADDVFIYDLTVQAGKLWGNIDTATRNTAVTRDVSSETLPTGVAVAYGSGVTEGTVFYVVGSGTDTIRKYTSSTAWTGTWTYVSTSDLSISGISSTSADICVSKDGNFIYVLDTNIIYQLTMEVAHESKSANTGSFFLGSQDTAPTEIRFSSDGTKMLMLGNTGDDIYRYDLPHPWVVSSANYISVSTITAPEATLEGFDISSDGTKYYMGGASEIVRQFNPSVAYGTTLTASSTKDIEFIMANDIRSIKFSNDGLKIFVCDNTNIYEFDLSVAFDLSTMNIQHLNAGANQTSFGGFFISPDGTRLASVGYATSNYRIHTYTLSTPWNLGTATLSNTSALLQDIIPFGISFNADGSKVYIAGQGRDSIITYNSSNYVLSSTTIVSETSLSNSYANPLGISFENNGKKLYVIADPLTTLVEFELDSAYDINSMFIDRVSQSTDTAPSCFYVNNEGDKAIFFGSTADDIFQLNLRNKWNLCNPIVNTTQSVTVPGTTVTGIWWNPTGTQVLMAEQGVDKIFRYEFSTPWSVSGTPVTNSSSTYNLLHDLNPINLAFSDDGYMMYYINGGGVIKQIQLEIPYYPDSSYSGVMTTSSQDSFPRSFCLNSTGNRLYVLGINNDDIFRYDLIQNYHITTATYVSSSDIGTRETNGTGLECNSDATKFWLVGGINDTIYQLSNSVANGLSATLTLDTSLSVTRVDNTPTSLFMGNNGSKLFFAGTQFDAIYSIDLFTPNNLANYDSRFLNVSTQIPTNLRSLTIDSTGTKLYAYGTESLFQYNISLNSSLASATYSNKFLYVGSGVGGPTQPIDVYMSSNGYYFYLLDQNLDNIRVYRPPLF